MKALELLKKNLVAIWVRRGSLAVALKSSSRDGCVYTLFLIPEPGCLAVYHQCEAVRWGRKTCWHVDAAVEYYRALVAPVRSEWVKVRPGKPRDFTPEGWTRLYYLGPLSPEPPAAA